MIDEISKFIESNKETIMIVFGIILAYIVIRSFYLAQNRVVEKFSLSSITGGDDSDDDDDDDDDSKKKKKSGPTKAQISSVKKALEKIQDNLDSKNKSLNEQLMVDKYKSDYENIIIAVDEIIDKEVVQGLAFELMGANASVDAIPPKMIERINSMMQFKKNLNGVMDSLDKASDSASSGVSSYF